MFFLCSRTQAPPEKCPAGVEEKQAERLLQSTWGGQERHRRWDQESLPQTGTFTSPRCLTEQKISSNNKIFIVQFYITQVTFVVFSFPFPSLQTVTAELLLRCRRKRRRSSRRWVRLSACFQTQRRSLATTAVRIWRMMAWTWEVSIWASLGVGGLEGEQIEVQILSELTNHLFY